ncbi:TetR/AcrR family transcriptional regulator [Plantibacter flavus]|uniref:TetR/AcrR family transcriptional regulator n=1 Tax=Plantibacter flavus TaxID=150123 RepID=UPI003F1750DC
MDTVTARQSRQRLSKPERHAQLLSAARELIRTSGTDEFTLARLAEAAGVTKPLVYDHFGDRSGVLAELYREFESRQRSTLAEALETAEPTLAAVTGIVAGAYIECCIAEGQELADVVAALAGSPALRELRQEAEDAYLGMCLDALQPFTGALDPAALQAVIGAGNALGQESLAGRISSDRARDTLAQVITAVTTETLDQNGPGTA